MFQPASPKPSTLLYRPKRSLMKHSLFMSSLIRLSHNTSLSTSSKLVGSLDGISVVVRRYYNASRISSWPKTRIFQVSLQGSSLMRSYRVENWG